MDNEHNFAVWSIPRCGSLVFQLLRTVIPVKLGNRASSVFVSICVSVVCKERKVSIRSGIDGGSRNPYSVFRCCFLAPASLGHHPTPHCQQRFCLMLSLLI